MDTQNTPVHIKLWHTDFWRLCFANLLLMSSVYMLVFAIPYFLLLEKFQMWQIPPAHSNVLNDKRVGCSVQFTISSVE